MKRTRTFPLLALSLATAVVVSASACSGGGGGDDDDDDDVQDLTHCQILWSNTTTNPTRYDVFVVDMPIEQWTTGTKTYTLDVSNEVVAIFYDDFDFDKRIYAARAITTAGTFDVTVASTSAGQPVSLNDPGDQLFFDIDGDGNIGGLVASGGAATFDGNWSDPDPDAPPDPGTGSVTLTLVESTGSAYVIGTDSVDSFVQYAVCYEDSASFAPNTTIQRVENQLVRALRR